MRIKVIHDDCEEDYRKWRRWFAWRPIFVDGYIVWLETVERRCAGIYPPRMADPQDYRLLTTPIH